MADNDGRPAWLIAELERLERADGQTLLEGIHAISRRFGEENDGDQQAEWLSTLMNVAWKQGRFDFELRAFGELRGLYNASEHFAYLRPQLLWYFKWLVERLPEHSDVPIETIERIFSDMESFYRAAGESLRPYYGLRCQAALYMGYSAAADDWYARWQAEPIGDSDDCAACEADRKIVYLLEEEDQHAALEAAKPLIEGDVACEETPATFSKLMIPALTAGQLDLALWLQRMSVRYIRKTPNMLANLASHVVFLTMLGRYANAERLAKIGLALANVSDNDFRKSTIYRGCAFCFAIGSLVGRREITLPASIFVTDSSPTGRVALPEASSRCLQEARAFSERLDRRNSTNRYQERTDSVEQAIRDAVEIAKKRRADGTLPTKD